MVKLLILATRCTLEIKNRVQALVSKRPDKYRNESDLITQAVKTELEREERDV